MYKWYLLQHKPNYQKISLTNLERQGFETFCPLIEKTTRINSKFKNSFLPLFPGYIFISFNMNESKWISIKYTLGVLRIVSFNNKPSEVPKDLILALQKKYNNPNKMSSLKNIKKGDYIKILKGPLSGFIGKIESYDEKNRLKILLEFMGNHKNISISANNTDVVS